jgi:hypothetical protein
MHRREFLGLIAATVAATALCGVASSATEEEVRRANYDAFRQRLKEVAEGGVTISWCSLARPRNGSRTALVYVEGRREPLRFEQPWEGECI